MKREERRLGVWVLIAVVATWSSACGNNSNNDGSQPAKVGEACTIDADCDTGLACRGAICTEVLTGGEEDMGGEVDMPDDPNTVTVTPEDYFISYVLQVGVGEDKGSRYLWLIDTSDETKTQLTTDPSRCEFGCWVSSDLSYLVYIRPAQGESAFNVFASSINEMDGVFEVAGEGSIIAERAQRVQFSQDRITFQRDFGVGKTAYYLQLGSTEEKRIGDLEVRGDGETQDSWYVDTRSNTSVVYSPGLQALSIRVTDSSEAIGAQDQVYLLDGSNYQEVGGSYFGTNIPTAVSPDGRYLAFFTTAPNNYDLCDDNTACAQDQGQHCGNASPRRCTVRELTIRLVDLDALDEISNGNRDGKKCTSDADCSQAHECDIPSTIQLDSARCIPRRVVLGLPNSPRQPRVGMTPKSGCELTSLDGEIGLRYTSVRSPMTFGEDGNLYVVAGREQDGADCEDDNIGDTDILRISPIGGQVDVITGNAGADFNGDLCYNDSSIDITNCVVYIKEALLSPGFQEIVFLATNPGATDKSRAGDDVDVWTILRDGTMREWLGKNGIFDTVVRFGVHDR